MGWTFAALSLLAMLCPLPLARRVRDSAPAPAAEPFVQQMRQAWRNRPFRTLLAAYFVQSVGQATSDAAVALVFSFVLGKVDLLISPQPRSWPVP